MISGIRYVIFIAFIFLIQACTQKVEVSEVKPENLIPRDSMVDILVDMQIMESILMIEQKRGSHSEVNEKKYELYNDILEKHNISKEEFDSSFVYYQNDLKVLDEIYADAITKLSKMKTNVNLE
ncbi:MAG: DUF4296 domain-containing protein [Bacteroidales bacterium]|nr:DUF4296 domain-containing protein [Bacteroidales bacterium]